MLSLSNLRRIASAFLIVATLFFTTAVVHQGVAMADTLGRDVMNANMKDQVSEAEYESAKASRQKEQAMRSEKAREEAEMKKKDIAEDRLNLDEAVPESVKEIVE